MAPRPMLRFQLNSELVAAAAQEHSSNLAVPFAIAAAATAEEKCCQDLVRQRTTGPVIIAGRSVDAEVFATVSGE